MNKYDQQYYFIDRADNDSLPDLTPDTNTEDRTFRYERQPVGTPPLVFFNGGLEYAKKLGIRSLKELPDILFDGSNPVVGSDIREKLLTYDIPNLYMHPTVYIHDDGKWYEDLWYMTLTERFDCWDRRQSEYEQDDPPIRLGGFELYQVYKYSLNEELLDKTPLEQRLLFQMGGTLDPFFVCHQKLLGIFQFGRTSGVKLTSIAEY